MSFLTVLRHVVAILALPTTVAVLVPYYILSVRTVEPTAVSVLAGGAIVGLGLTLVATTVWHFASVGRGTLAPWDPPRRLVVTGVYRHVRNPMIAGVILILLGESVVFRSMPLLRWAALFSAINATYIPLLEERWLTDRFGDEYREYRRHVPRWVPRATPWQPPPARRRDEPGAGHADRPA